MADEIVVASRHPYRGKLVNLRIDTVRFDNGDERIREVVEHPGAVGVLPVLDSGDLVLVRQYRHAVGRQLLEIPAGTREPDEPEERTAARELREETGYQAGSLRRLASFYVSPGWANEQLTLFLATGLEAGTARPEADERLALVRVGPDRVAGLIRDGEIADAKTIVAVLSWLGNGRLLLGTDDGQPNGT